MLVLRSSPVEAQSPQTSHLHASGMSHVVELRDGDLRCFHAEGLLEPRQHYERWHLTQSASNMRCCATAFVAAGDGKLALLSTEAA